MHDIFIGFINDWSRKVMASKVFLLVQNWVYLFRPEPSWWRDWTITYLTLIICLWLFVYVYFLYVRISISVSPLSHVTSGSCTRSCARAGKGSFILVFCSVTLIVTLLQFYLVVIRYYYLSCAIALSLNFESYLITSIPRAEATSLADLRGLQLSNTAVGIIGPRHLWSFEPDLHSRSFAARRSWSSKENWRAAQTSRTSLSTLPSSPSPILSTEQPLIELSSIRLRHFVSGVI